MDGDEIWSRPPAGGSGEAHLPAIPAEDARLTLRSVSRRTRTSIGAAIVLGLLVVSVGVLFTFANGGGATEVVGAPGTAAGAGSSPAITSGASASAANSEIFVHVSGAVRAPGLYRLGPGSRVVDAVTAAGGFEEGADRDQANLARLLVDGEQLHVPREGEQVPAGAEPAGSANGGSAIVASGGPVSLNRAGAAELQSLPQVGPATAQSIIDWRTQNGPFTSVEQLMSISGIGQKTYDRLKDLVTL